MDHTPQRIDENHSFSPYIAEQVGVYKAILLKDIYYWCLQNLLNKKHLHGERPWTYNTAKALGEKYRYMKPSSIARWLDELEEEDWIESGNFNEAGYDRTKWYSINFKKYDEAVKAAPALISQNEKSISQNEKSISQNETPYHLINSPQSLIIGAGADEKITNAPETPEGRRIALIWGEDATARIDRALSSVHSHLKASPGKWKELADKARNPLNKAQFADELDAWIRRNANNYPVITDPVKALESGLSNFLGWLREPRCQSKYKPRPINGTKREEPTEIKYRSVLAGKTTQK